VLTLSRSGFLGLGCGLAVLAWPLRRQLLQARVVAPVLGGIALLGVALASSPYVRQVVRSRVTLSDNSAKVHFQFFDLVQPVLDAHPVFGLGLNTFSVYYQFLTGKTNWGPHSFYIALLDETGLVGACVFAAFLVWVGIRLAVILRASRALERRGDPEAGEWRALGIGLTAGLAATLVANVFYLTMQFYYFYAFTALALAIPVVFARTE
jgi:O-antigen ligase